MLLRDDQEVIGRRLSLKNKTCTVRYVGPVAGKPGVWLGVEWDDPSRGKHAGSHEDVAYFRPKSPSPTSSSFVKVSTVWDDPVSFSQALRAKYAPSLLDAEAAAAPAGDVITIGGKRVEEIGYEKISAQQARLDTLENVILDHSLLSRIGPETDIARLCPNVQHLDLSQNLYEELGDVAEIVQQLPQLKSLVLDGNRLNNLALELRNIHAFQHITTLHVNDILLTRQELATICQYTSRLRYLSAARNLLNTGDECFLPVSLQELTLDGNGLSSMADVATLVHSCNVLGKLSLRSNDMGRDPVQPLTAIVLPSSVQSLDLSENAITSWSFIDSLSQVVPGLQHLELTTNPIYDSSAAPNGQVHSPAEVSMLIIARLPLLETLNRSSITAKDRLEAEKFHLFLIVEELANAPAECEQDILARHPRYQALCAEYGKPSVERSNAALINPNTLAARLITCRFYCASASRPGMPTRSTPLVLRLPKSLNIYAVMGLVGKRLSILLMHFRLIWETGERDPANQRPGQKMSAFDWSSGSDTADETAADKADRWIEREVELTPGTRPLGTYLETKDAWLRIEEIPQRDLAS